MHCKDCRHERVCELRVNYPKLTGCEGYCHPIEKSKDQVEQELEDRYWDDYASMDGYY